MKMNITDIELDIGELKKLLLHCSRDGPRRLVEKEINSLTAQLAREKAAVAGSMQNENDTSMSVDGPTTITSSVSKAYTVQVERYAMDQSDAFVKLYITISDVQKLPKDNVKCSYTDRSFKLQVLELNGKNYELSRQNLAERIIPTESKFKIKTNSIVVMLKKASEGITWPGLTDVEKKEKDKKANVPAPKYDDKADPNTALMDMMKKMYDDGDDEMKRTIAKAWSESRDKQQAGGAGGMPGMPAF